jgi:hypothetical protein
VRRGGIGLARRQSTLHGPDSHCSKMHRIFQLVRGVPADVGAVAAWQVYANFPEARQC